MEQKEFEQFTIFLAFANSPIQPLGALEAEFNGIREIIEVLAASKKNPISMQAYGKINRAGLSNTLSLYLEHLYLFHFSGHANEAILQLEGNNADGESLAGLFALASNLKLVFLNGCATHGHVKTLMDAQIPAVIATTAKVGDNTAAIFSQFFYREFIARGRRLEDAFNAAKHQFNLDPIIKKEDIAIRDTAEGIFKQSDDPIPWGIYLNPLYKQSQILDWQIVKTYPFSKISQQTSNNMLPLVPRNPYIVGSPIKEPVHFFGRQNLFPRILESETIQLCLIGIRRIGKTSFLRQIEDRYTVQNQKIAIYLNLQGLKTVDDIGNELLRSIQRVATKHPIIESFQIYHHNDHCNNVLHNWIEFCNLKNLYSILLVDEAEQLECISPEDLGEFKGLLDRNSSISIVITGSRFLRSLKMKESIISPLINTFEVRILSIFENAEVHQLVSQNNQVEVDLDTMEEIRRLSGHHPFLIQYIAHKLYHNGSLSPLTPDSRALILSKDLSLILEDEFTRLTDSEKQIMWTLAFEEPTDLRELQRDQKLLQTKLRSDLLDLEELGFIRCTGSQYFLNNIFWHQYLEMIRNLDDEQAFASSIFISHHIADHDYLQKLKTFLFSTKAELKDSTSLPLGASIEQSIENEINKASIILLLLSQEYIVDPQKIAERNAVKALRDKGKRVIPIVVKHCNWREEFGSIKILPEDQIPLKNQTDLELTLTKITEAIVSLLKKS